MARPRVSERLRTAAPADLAALLRGAGEALPGVGQEDAFAALFDRFGAARVVLLGEATHGTSEFYRARAAISRRLIERHGFTIVAVEADWPDAARIDRYVRWHEHKPSRNEAFTRFPTWMWRNTEAMAFIDWLRQHNEGLAPADRTEFRGLDIYSLAESIEAVLTYLDRFDPEAAKAARRRYGCLTPWQDEPTDYGLAVLRGQQSCEDEVVAQLRELLALRLDGIADLDAAQNARIVRAAEQYYRIMYHGSVASWNLRDRHMFDTLQAVLAARGPGAKAIVWAHNSHIGDAAATAMGWGGEFNIGELCRTAHGDDAVLIGFGTDHGTVAAASNWGGPMEIKNVRPARTDSWEHAFHLAGLPQFLTEWRSPSRRDLRPALAGPLLERAIGVIYRPETERQSHYFEAVLAEQFDALVWFDETTAVAPLPAARPHGVPETFPFGV